MCSHRSGVRCVVTGVGSGVGGILVATGYSALLHPAVCYGLACTVASYAIGMVWYGMVQSGSAWYGMISLDSHGSRGIAWLGTP